MSHFYWDTLYEGKSTQPFKRRHLGHGSEIKNQICGLEHKYGGPIGYGYENLSITMIKQVGVGNPFQLAQRETYWQINSGVMWRMEKYF